MMTPKHCPYCFDTIERTRYWYRRSHEDEPPTAQELHGDDIRQDMPLSPMGDVDEMVMAMPCRHSFDSDLWETYRNACTHYSAVLEEIQTTTAGESILVDQLDNLDRAMRITAEECCTTMERTAPKGVLNDA